MIACECYDVVMEGEDECLIQKVNHMDFSRAVIEDFWKGIRSMQSIV